MPVDIRNNSNLNNNNRERMKHFNVKVYLPNGKIRMEYAYANSTWEAVEKLMYGYKELFRIQSDKTMYKVCMDITVNK